MGRKRRRKRQWVQIQQPVQSDSPPQPVDQPRPKLNPLFTHFLTLVIGLAPSVYWYAEWHVQSANLANDMRKQVNSLEEKMFHIVTEVRKAEKIQDSIERERTISLLMDREKIIDQEFSEWEAKLARIEGREPRRILLDHIPPGPPAELTVQ